MATLKLTSLHCQRRNDLEGLDEPQIVVNKKAAWTGAIGKGDTQTLSTSVEFDDVATVVLQELDGSKPQQIGTAYTVSASGGNQVPLVFKTSGTHYELYYQITNKK
ncbi:hypothetical protein [Nakamurella lactea]|uniref:hypothetical protein n=1 Tax=Nakamurella lactea TaxID=459515 RepID=UPI00040AA156|nr:hypothetical protein [Nakamurella lactea]